MGERHGIVMPCMPTVLMLVDVQIEDGPKKYGVK